ncbi:MAG: hypothetical protein HON14_14885 [Rhodospirillaceae bacterium]|jgi:hypothetical protein|nr:hypothetical protein [Rhodospirillaceae bacterium]MBT5939548.1 hypothetical protein [Rhodospirillaceae bacterium]
MEDYLKKQTAYIDGEDLLLELAVASHGTKIYPSIEDIEQNHGHSLDECGIAEVEIRFVRWVKPSRFEN